MKDDIQVRIAGVAGDGSFLTGDILASALKKFGYYVVTIRDFPSNIRGLPSNYTVRGSLKPIFGRKDFDDFLIAFDPQSVKMHLKDLTEGSICICNVEEKTEFTDNFIKKGVHYIKVPLRDIARKEFSLELIKNMVAFGMLSEIFDFDDVLINYVVLKHFKRKGERVIELNKKAIQRGRELVREKFKGNESVFLDYRIIKSEDKRRILAMGNELVSMGAIAAGLRFLAAYPITPASEVLEFLSKEIPKFGGVAIQAEDEIASINMALGASYAGLRSMASSSGPGIALMTEAISYAGMAEIPIVIYYAMRSGPATGLPTKTSQEDILFIIFAGHGEFPKIVLTPGTPEEMFYLTTEAFNLAEEFQVPVIILTDQFLAQNRFTLDRDKIELKKIEIKRGKLVKVEENSNIPSKDGFLLRYKIEEDGISNRFIPGIKLGVFGTTGLEHDEAGYDTEDEEVRIKMVEKRMRKIIYIKEKVPKPQILGPKESIYGIISFGSTYGPIIEVIDRFKKKGIDLSFFRILTLWPFPEEEIKRFAEGKEKIFVVEQNKSGQLQFLVENAIPICKNKIVGVRKYSGRTFRPIEIEEKIREEIEK